MQSPWRLVKWLLPGILGSLIAGTLTCQPSPATASEIGESLHWQPLGGEFFGNCTDIVTTKAGDVFIAGNFSQIEQRPMNFVAVWKNDGWKKMGKGFNRTCEELHLSPGGQLYAAGYFTRSGGTKLSKIAVWSKGRWQNPIPQQDFTDYIPYYLGSFGKSNTIISGRVEDYDAGLHPNYLLSDDGKLTVLQELKDGDCVETVVNAAGTTFLVGDFNHTEGNDLDQLVRWEQVGWSKLGNIFLDGDLNSVAYNPNNDHLYIGGDFKLIDLSTQDTIHHLACFHAGK